MKATRVRITVAAALFAWVLAMTAPAAAATRLAPLASLSMQVQRTNSVLLVSAQLAGSVKLPAMVGIPVPAGSKPYWVGEVLGGDPSKDPKAQYTTQKAKGYDLIVFEVTQARLAQVEVSLPAAAPAGAPATLSYSLPIVSDVARASLTLQLPSGAAVASSTAGLVASQDAGGGQVLTKVVKSPKRGTSLKGSVSYTVSNASAASPVAPASDAGDVLALPLWILAAGIAGLFGKTVLDRRAAARAEPEGDDGGQTPEAEEPPVKHAAKRDAAKPRKKAEPQAAASGVRAGKAPTDTGTGTAAKRPATARKKKPS